MTDVITPATAASDLLAHPPAACKPLDGGLQIPLTLLTPSPLNPRKRWTPERVVRMAASLKSSGQVQPIRVRPNPLYRHGNGRAPYEIVVGETRWRAAPEAGLAMLDAVVGDYTDQQVIELGVVENTDRNDLHPLEEAEAYEALLRKLDGLQGYATVPDLAARFGQSPSYVYQRLKLLQLCPAGREAFLADRLKASVALLIARMPDLAEQAKATATLAAGWGGEPYSFRSAAEMLQRDYMLALAKAPFDIQAGYGVAGPCHQCPKRSGAAPDLFADVTGGDMCQDSRCYQAKVEEARQIKLAADRVAEAAAPPVAQPVASPTAPADTGLRAPGAAAMSAADGARKPAKTGAPEQGGAGAAKLSPKAVADAHARADDKLARRIFAARMFREAMDAIRAKPANAAGLRMAVAKTYETLGTEAIALLYAAYGWLEPAQDRINAWDADFLPRLDDAAPQLLGELMIAMPLAETLSNDRLDLQRLEGTHLGYADERRTAAALRALGVEPTSCWKLAQAEARTRLAREAVAAEGARAAASTAADVNQKPISQTMAEAFISQHSGGAAAAALPAAAKAAKGVKYRCPSTEQTWSGRGLMPRWLKVALELGDRKLADFEVHATPASAGTPTATRPLGTDQTDEGDA